MSVIFGAVPRPPELRDAFIDKPYAWDDLGQRVMKGVCLHTTIGGELMTTDFYFRDPSQGGYTRALTDFGVAAAGYALYWNALNGRRAPWASGPWLGGEGDGPAYVATYGISGINRNLGSIEFEGINYDVPLTAKQLDLGIRLIAWVIDTYAKIPWDVWPKNNDGVQAIYYHREFTGSAYKLCPGNRVAVHIDEIIAGVQDQLKHYQTGDTSGSKPPPAPVYAARKKPPAIDGKDHELSGHRFWATSRVVTTTHDHVPCLQYATPTASPVRAPLGKGQQFTVAYVVRGDDFEDSDRWWVTPSGTRIPMAWTTPRIDIAENKEAA